MWKLRNDHRGAVTVFITLLLIPAILITGTAVDIARIYAVRGIVKDANQMAANSALAYYDSLLKDLYSLFAIAQDDPELGAMLDAYITATVFSEAEGAGTFTFFRGKKVPHTTEIVAFPEANLSNPVVMRQQIEEYMKYRGPVLIVQQLLDRAEQFTKLKNDAQAIFDKLEIDEAFEDLGNLYEEFYYRLRYNDYYLYSENRQGLEIWAYDLINERMAAVVRALDVMKEAQEDYLEAFEEMDELEDPGPEASAEERAAYRDAKEDAQEKMDRAEERFQAAQLLVRISADEIDKAVASRGSASYISDDHGSDHYYNHLDGCCLESYRDNLAQMIPLARKIDKAVEDLRKQIEELEGSLDDCSAELAGDENSGLRHELKQYEAFFLGGGQNDIVLEELMLALQDHNKGYLDAVQEHLQNVLFGAVTGQNAVDYLSPGAATTDTLRTVAAGASVDALVKALTLSSVPYQERFLELAAVDECRYDYYYDNHAAFYGEDMVRFAGLSQKTAELYIQLSNMFNVDQGSGRPDKGGIRKLISNMGKNTASKLEGLSMNAEGADYIPKNIYRSLTSNGASELDSDYLSSYARDEDLSNLGDSNKAAKGGLNKVTGFFDKLKDIPGAVVDKGLLLTYDSEMFSSFTTLKRDKDAQSLTGIPFGTDVNYFLGSELEYLLIGSDSEFENLSSVASLLFLTRFVFNYISTFTVTGVKTILGGIQAAFAWSGPFAVVIKELARVGMAMGESMVDVMTLRAGQSVPVMKNDTTWKFLGLQALIGEITQEVANAALSTVVQQVQQSLLEKLSSLRGSWTSLSGSVKETLNQAEEIDNMIRELTGAETPVGSIAEKLRTGMDEIDTGFDTFQAELDGMKAPKIELDIDADLPDFDVSASGAKPKLSTTLELYYEDYLRLYIFLFVNGDLLGQRTADLIALNLTNYSQKLGASPDAMAGATIYDMRKAMTFVGVRTELTMDFLFLPMANTNYGGTSFSVPGPYTLVETDYRGY